ncbi:MAG: hypothetical protein M1834_001675 [Cirrosporium novae-zelandiae]|nr:MAG: hypothetical protein M1834_001675 [Cirrosporium novae-zelandiae]
MPLPSRSRSLREPKTSSLASAEQHRRHMSILAVPAETIQESAPPQPSRIAPPKILSNHASSNSSETTTLKRRSLLPQRSNTTIVHSSRVQNIPERPTLNQRSSTQSFTALGNKNIADTSTGALKRPNIPKTLSLHRRDDSGQLAAKTHARAQGDLKSGSSSRLNSPQLLDEGPRSPELPTRSASPASTVSTTSRLSAAISYNAQKKVKESLLKDEYRRDGPPPRSLRQPMQSYRREKGEDGSSQEHGNILEKSRQVKRPAFSTYQQHFTPRKTTKALTATFLHPPSQAPDSSVSSYDTRLQAELLQLHLLHRESSQVQQDWDLSARKHFEESFTSLVSFDRKTREAGVQAVEARNLNAVSQWNGGSSDYQPVERIQRLAQVIQEVSSLTHNSGRYTIFSKQFEEWYMWAQSQIQNRNDSKSSEDAAPQLIESLGDGWRREASALERKLVLCVRDLESLEGAPAGSALAQVLVSHKEITTILLDQTKTMQVIEREMVSRDRQWLEAIVQEISTQASNMDAPNTTTLVPAWR